MLFPRDSLAQTIEHSDLPADQRDPLLAALREAASPAFMAGEDATEWREMVFHILQQAFTPISKAQKIAAMVALWQRERGEGLTP